MNKLSVSLQTLESLFPFSFVINQDDEIIHMGPSLRKIIAPREKSPRIDQIFKMAMPTTDMQLARTHQILGKVLTLKLSDKNVRLMGQIIQPSNRPLYVFVGSLIVTEADQLKQLNLTFSDFPIQDQVFDFLLLTQTQKRGIEEAEILNKKLVEARDFALKASELKSQFLANMSHELRTPMNGILGMASILQETTVLDEEQTLYVNGIVESAENMLSLVNDILDLSKIESGSINLEVEWFEIRALLEDIRFSMGVAAQKKGNELMLSVAEGVPQMAFGDRLRLRQVLLNLIGNANKFTSNGKVSIYIEVSEFNGSELKFTVQDTGIGMNRSTLSKIFNPFVQGDSTMSRVYGGTGLGLSICKKLVEAMDGKISVTSEPGKGSKFVFTAVILEDVPKDQTRSLSPQAQNKTVA